MKVRYFKSLEARRIRRNLKRRERRQERRVRIAKWHKKFAWLPTKISTPDDDNEHSTAVLFETVMQKGRITNNFGEDMPQFDKTVWTRYPEKEYFKKKLDGTLEEEEQFADFTHDGTDMNMSSQGSGAAGVSKGSPIKKGGTSRPSIGPPR